MDQRKDLLKDSIKVLNEREKEILYSRRLTDEPLTLEDLSKKYKISRERIRQIENKAFEKLQKHMINSAKSKNLITCKLNLLKGSSIKIVSFLSGLVEIAEILVSINFSNSKI